MSEDEQGEGSDNNLPLVNQARGNVGQEASSSRGADSAPLRRFASASAHAAPQRASQQQSDAAQEQDDRLDAREIDWDVHDDDDDDDELSDSSIGEDNIDLMLPAQRARWNRMLAERYVLLRFSSEPHGNNVLLRFTVRGARFHSYHLVVDLERCCMTCSCIDFREGALERDVLCKHCCFVLHRILHVAHNGVFCHMPQRFLAPRLLRKVVHAARAYLERARDDRFVEASAPSNAMQRGAVVRQSGELSSRLAAQNPLHRLRATQTHSRKRARKPAPAESVERKALDAETLFQFGVGPFGVFQALDAEVAGDATCGVCLEDFGHDIVVVRCGTCRQFVHRTCIDLWLRRSRADRKCVFCRAMLTYALL
jgi:hypothetical protein